MSGVGGGWGGWVVVVEDWEVDPPGVSWSRLLLTIVQQVKDWAAGAGSGRGRGITTGHAALGVQGGRGVMN